MQEGELWELNNQLTHAAFNDSDEPRVHIIFDVLSPVSLAKASISSLRYRTHQAWTRLIHTPH